MDVAGSWSFQNPVKIWFGALPEESLFREISGKRLLVVSSKSGRARFENWKPFSKLDESCHLSWFDQVTSNPNVLDLELAIEDLSKIGPFDAVIGFGGGSVLDSAKVFAAAGLNLSRPHSLRDLIAFPERLSRAGLIPLYALPTTAGTGSEVTPFATVWDSEEKKKLSLSGPLLYPKMAVVGFDWLRGLPQGVIASSGLDALNQAFESIWNRNATALTLSVAFESIRLGLTALPNLMSGSESTKDLRDMAMSSLMAGVAISQTQTSICHSISYPLTAHFGIPHGVACAFSMSAILEQNLKQDDGRFSRLSSYLGDGYEDFSNLLHRIRSLNETLGVAAQVRQKVGSLENLAGLQPEMVNSGRWANALVTPNDLGETLELSWGEK